MKNDTLFTLLSSLLLLVVVFTTHASQSDINQETQYYADIFLGNDFAQQRTAMERLVWAGISSPTVYEPLADKLAGSKESKNKAEVEKASWYAKALALSGNQKYRPLLQDIRENAKSSKLRKYTKQALIRLDKYAAWNPVISQNLVSVPTGSLEQQRILNMLSATDLELTRVGAKRVYYEHSADPVVVAAAVRRLEKEIAIQGKDDIRIDTVAWLIKGIGISANLDYKGLLENIASTHSSSKVRKHAKKALKNY